MPHRQGPQIGKVLKFNSGSGDNSYSARVRILTSGSLKETDRILEDVPYSPIWAGSNGAGVYAPLPENTLVIVGYIEFDPSHPYIEGVWGEFYNAADFKPEELLITNGSISITAKPEELLITNGSISIAVKANELHLNGDNCGGVIKVKKLIPELQKNTKVLEAIKAAIENAPKPDALPAALFALKMPFGVLPLGNFSNYEDFENHEVKHGY